MALLAPRSEQSLGKLKDTTNQYFAAPAYIQDVRRYPTGQIPVNQVCGTANNASTLFAGDFSQGYLGVRTEFGINIYEQPAATTGQVLMLAWMRCDL